jgi:hypothetical protein
MSPSDKRNGHIEPQRRTHPKTATGKCDEAIGDPVQSNLQPAVYRQWRRW